MRNRAIQVKMVKTEDKEETTSTTEPPFETKVTLIGNYIKEAVTVAGKMALAYVLVDTVRQVAIEKAKK